MDQKKRFQITPSFVISCIALFVAMSGTAVALKGKNTVDSGDIKPGAVKTRDIGLEAVQASSIGGQTIGEQQLQYHGVDSTNLKDDSVNSRTLGPTEVISSGKIELGAYTVFGTAQCPPGEVLLSGGVELDGTTKQDGVTINTQLIASGPDVSTPRAWFGEAYAEQHFGWMKVFAVCLT